MSRKIQIKGLRGTIYKRGDQSYRVQLSLGRNAEGKYDIKRETIRGTEQDAIDLLTRWNVEYLDNTIIASNHQTVKQAYEEWIEFIREYRKPNTHRFYRERFESDILPMIGHRRLKDIKLSDLQKIMKEYPTKTSTTSVPCRPSGVGARSTRRSGKTSAETWRPKQRPRNKRRMISGAGRKCRRCIST